MAAAGQRSPASPLTVTGSRIAGTRSMSLRGGGNRAGLAEGAQHERGIESRHHCLPSLVFLATGQAAPVQSRLYRVTGEYAVPDRSPGVERDPGQAGCHRVADVLEVGRTAADDHAQAG